MDKLTISQAKQLDDNDIEIYLKKIWDIEDNNSIDVVGELYSSYNQIRNIYHYRIYNLYLKNGQKIEYPIEDLDYRSKIKKNGIYIPPNFDEKIKSLKDSHEKLLISCKLILSSLQEREKHNNPFLLNVDAKSIQLLKILKKEEIIKDTDGNILISNSIVQKYLKENEKTITIALKKQQEKEKKVNLEIKEIEEKLISIQESVEKELEEIKKNFSNQKKSYDIKLGESKAKLFEKQKEIKTLESLREDIILDIESKENSIEELIQKIEKLKEILKEEEQLMGKKLEKLRSFIKDKADTLLGLGFIDQEEYDSLLMIQEYKESNEKFVDFHSDLLEDKQSLISHIQAYLFEKDIIYPRYIIEDFYALVQTNDLIILAGESGSGKTNLIKSFADAIGGKSFIIPVKPNWTSSEDLLGYYNPLEKKYLATPFLEALLEAKDNPTIPYFICLDEMNLARIEYYFADFLSLLEERGELPEIKLYSDDESAHILSEFTNVMKTIEVVKDKYKKKNIVSFIELLQDEDINRELTRIFGFSDKDSLIKYHTDLRRMLSGILNTPSSITFPKNVRIIGAINIDETTHYLSPKILDRAHIMKFDSPLLQDWIAIADEIENIKNKELKVKLTIKDLGERETYPKYDREDEFCKIITEFTREYFSPLGIEVGLRTIRQGLNYQKIFDEQGSDKDLVLNNFLLHKILPKMTFDGNKKVNGDKKSDLLQRFFIKLKEHINQALVKEKSIDVVDELEYIIKVSESNDGIVNYWA